MKLIHTATELKPGNKKVCLAIGFFDGVHLGHQQIIRQTITDARHHNALALVLTFDQHPNTIVAPHRVPPLIYSLAQKTRAIESLGGDALLLIHFDRAFSEQTGEAFVRNLVRDLESARGRHSGPPRVRSGEGAAGRNPVLQSVCVGANFAFGHKRSGNVALLKQLGEELRFTVHGLEKVSLDGRVVSSTRIREAIGAGNLDAAGQMLGRSYALGARIVPGDRLGRGLGFPTANLDVTGLVLPPNGVYAAHAAVRGRSYRAVVNIGHRPTLQNPIPLLRVEAHLPDFSGELYGEDIEITFAEKLRDEKKFPSLAALREQIALDIAEAKRRL
jgi:riboflavin kinase/FMN adenylyltransferase